MASNADQSDCAGAPSLKLSTLKRLREVIRQRSGKNDARERGCSNTEDEFLIPDDSEMCAYSKSLPAECNLSTDALQDAGRGEHFCTEEQQEPNAPVKNEGVALEASIEDFMQVELKEGPAMELPVQRLELPSHEENPLLLCSLCPFATRYPSTLKDHEESHTWKKVKCDLCPKTFATQRMLQKHMCSSHTGKKPFKCDQCPYTTLMEYYLERHKIEHLDVNVFLWSEESAFDYRKRQWACKHWTREKVRTTQVLTEKA
nr:zinc finger E-box-binding homeobox protein zag-1-like [Rhipicephalus microplus]